MVSPIWGTEAPKGSGPSGVRWTSLSSYRSRYKALICDCYGFAVVFNLLFCLPRFWGKGAPRGLTMVPLGRELSIQTTLICGTVWPQFAMQVLTGGRGGRMGSEMGSAKKSAVNMSAEIQPKKYG